MEITVVKDNKLLNEFIKLPHSLYKDDPLYIPQLDLDMRTEFSHKNPFMKHSEVKYFLLEKDGAFVGRAASIVNNNHIECQGEKAGFFGFFECINDERAAGFLLERVAGELRAAGMSLMRGPMNFSTNETCGLLAKGFAEPPVLMMPYNPPYYVSLMEAHGMRKAKDLFAYDCDIPVKLPEKIIRAASVAEKRGVRARTVSNKTFKADMRAFRDVYNSAWAGNWGFIPLTDEELEFTSSKLKRIYLPELTLIAEKDGEPAGFMGMLPDYNFVLGKISGRLTPLSVLKALYYSRKITGLRLLLLGIKKSWRLKGVDALLYREAFEGIKKSGRPFRKVEFSWILEDNLPVRRLVETIGGRLYKKYRIYEKEI